MINDSFSFANFIRSQQFDTTIKLASVDVESLFINVPVNETIKIILQRCFPKDVKLFKGFTRNVFKHLLELVISESYFIFNNVTYLQKDGVAMDSPLGSFFANIFMSAHESSWLENAPYKSILY